MLKTFNSIVAAGILFMVAFGAVAQVQPRPRPRPAGNAGGADVGVAAEVGDVGFGPPGAGRGGKAGGAKDGGTGQWSKAQWVVVAKVEEAAAGPVGQSMPPLHTHRVRLTIEQVLRGDVKEGETIVAHHAARQMEAPVFPIGKSCVAAISSSRDSIRLDRLEEATPELIEKVKLASSMPLGWTVADGKPVSPWAALGAAAWPAAGPRDPAIKVTCARTGRPAYMAGPNVEFMVEKVPPKKEIQWTNPDGDGEYRITVTNPGDKPVVVPALLSVAGGAAADMEKNILWQESLVILCQDKSYTCPGSRGVAARLGADSKVGPTTLAPRQSVSTVVNALALSGPEWPRGGYRIEFQFCLGEKGSTQSFYYMSRHHDALRAAASKKKD